MSQEQFKDALLTKMLQVEEIEQEFGKMHLLVDRLFENSPNMTQNSNMFQVRFALILSSIV